MATSPEYLHHAAAVPRTLADTALDGLREAVLVVDAQDKRLPIILANAGARRCLVDGVHNDLKDDTSLLNLIGPQSSTIVEAAIGSLSNEGGSSHVLRWRLVQGETSLATEFKALESPPTQRLVMLSFAAHRDCGTRLQSSEQLLRTITANTADTLLLVDADLRIRFINRGVGGIAADRVVGQEISFLIPKGARRLVMAKLRRVLATGESAFYESESTAGGDQKQYFENRAVLVTGAEIGTSISITVSDITERKRLEQEILDVSGRERQTIGRDLHDGLGQELTGIALMLRGLAAKIQGRCPGAVRYVNEIVAVVNQSIENSRSLARGLLPVRSDSGGLVFALRTLAARSRDLYGLEVNFCAEVGPELTLDETNASHLYRIAQEALTNAARHGHASLVDISLQATKHSFLLRITDDGAGITGAATPTSGMGLRNMKYRAGMIGAKFQIGPNVPRGTVVRVTGEQPVAASKLDSARAI